jgi:hypothetical protein
MAAHRNRVGAKVPTVSWVAVRDEVVPATMIAIMLAHEAPAPDRT